MPKKELTKIKLQISAGKATPAPPVGPALGQHGVNIQDFCNQFNEASKNRGGDIVPIIITVYEDRSFTFIMKTPPASTLIMKAAGIQKGAKNPLTDKAGKITKQQLREIAEAKLQDLNTTNIENAMKTIAGTARQMGVKVEGYN